MTEVNIYVDKLSDHVYKKMSNDICESKMSELVLSVMKHTEDSLFKFHEYYIETLSDKFKMTFMSSDNFFRKFKYEYALQGISNAYLDEQLEIAKSDILGLIEQNKLSELYFNYFFQVKMPVTGNKFIVKNLGSFFAKLVHTFNPSEYCALDNPVKDYFKLQNESFFISFFVISDAYRKWAKEHLELLSSIRTQINYADKQNCLQVNKLSDMKLFDLIFRINATPKDSQI